MTFQPTILTDSFIRLERLWLSFTTAGTDKPRGFLVTGKRKGVSLFNAHVRIPNKFWCGKYTE
jgi:hypothetical protein